MRHLCLGLALLLAAGGCAREQQNSDTAVVVAANPEVERARAAASAANAIERNPTAADSILRAEGYTRASFEQAMYEIAADSALSAAYAAAKTR